MSQQPKKTLKDLHRKSRWLPHYTRYWLRKYINGEVDTSHGDAIRAFRRAKLMHKQTRTWTRLGEEVIKEMRREQEAKQTKSDTAGKGDTGQGQGDNTG